MLFESSRQAPTFLVFVSAGILLGIIYDILYLFRRRRRGILLHLSDAVFAACFFLILALTALAFTSGTLRSYMLLAVLTGFVTARATVGNFIKITIDFFAKIMYNITVKLRLGKLLRRLTK